MNESMFSQIDLIRQDSKDVRDFVKKVFSDREFKSMSKDTDFIKYLKSIYEGTHLDEEHVKFSNRTQNGTITTGSVQTTNETINEVNNRLNKKVKSELDAYLKGTKINSPEHQHAIMMILKGALTDANFHSEAKQLPKFFPKAKQSKYVGTAMEGVIEDKGAAYSKAAKWDGHDIIDAFSFYTSMAIGGSFGKKLETLKESISESVNEGKYNYKADALTAYFKGKIDAKELDKIARDDFKSGIATKKELSNFLSNKFTQDVMSDTYGIPAGTLIKRVRGLMKFAEGVSESVVNEGSVANKWNIQSQDIGKLQKKTSFSSETSMPFSLISNLSGGVNSTDKGIVSGHFNKDVVILQFYPKEDSRNDTMYDAVDKKGIIAIDKLMKKQYGLSMVSPFLLKGKRHCSADGEVCSVSNYLVFGGTNESIEERVNLFLEKNVPTDASKWSYYKSQAKKKFDVYPSAYANGWAAKKYKAAGGGWKTEK